MGEQKNPKFIVTDDVKKSTFGARYRVIKVLPPHTEDSTNESSASSKRNCSMCMNNKEMESLTELDSNSDGKISLAEYLSKPDKKFKSLDSNKDGYISKEEMSNKDKTDVHAHH